MAQEKVMARSQTARPLPGLTTWCCLPGGPHDAVANAAWRHGSAAVSHVATTGQRNVAQRRGS